MDLNLALYHSSGHNEAICQKDLYMDKHFPKYKPTRNTTYRKISKFYYKKNMLESTNIKVLL